MNSITILTSSNHHLKNSFDETKYQVLPVDPYDIESLSGNDFANTEVILDFTCFPTDAKRDLIERLSDIYEGALLSDLTINWVELFFNEAPNLHGAIAASFFSPSGKYEIAFPKEVSSELKKDFITLLSEVGLKTKEIKYPGICFNYPRIISQIINEAYFAKEENLASNEDIDKAMLYGVNYPLGPFDWASKIGLDKVALVLRELYQATGDNRYRMSRYIKEAII